ncbi:MAG: hypothetical protein ACJ76P_05315 [Actinomycetota bacterium]
MKKYTNHYSAYARGRDVGKPDTETVDADNCVSNGDWLEFTVGNTVIQRERDKYVDSVTSEGIEDTPSI